MKKHLFAFLVSVTSIFSCKVFTTRNMHKRRKEQNWFKMGLKSFDPITVAIYLLGPNWAVTQRSGPNSSGWKPRKWAYPAPPWGGVGREGQGGPISLRENQSLHIAHLITQTKCCYGNKHRWMRLAQWPGGYSREPSRCNWARFTDHVFHKLHPTSLIIVH